MYLLLNRLHVAIFSFLLLYSETVSISIQNQHSQVTGIQGHEVSLQWQLQLEKDEEFIYMWIKSVSKSGQESQIAYMYSDMQLIIGKHAPKHYTGRLLVNGDVLTIKPLIYKYDQDQKFYVTYSYRKEAEPFQGSTSMVHLRVMVSPEIVLLNDKDFVKMEKTRVPCIAASSPCSSLSWNFTDTQGTQRTVSMLAERVYLQNSVEYEQYKHLLMSKNLDHENYECISVNEAIVRPKKELQNARLECIAIARGTELRASSVFVMNIYIPPSKPTNLVTEFVDGKLKVFWTPPEDLGNPKVINRFVTRLYQVKGDTNSFTETRLRQSPCSQVEAEICLSQTYDTPSWSNSTFITELTSFTYYAVSVSAINDAGEGKAAVSDIILVKSAPYKGIPNYIRWILGGTAFFFLMCIIAVAIVYYRGKKQYSSESEDEFHFEKAKGRKTRKLGNCSIESKDILKVDKHEYNDITDYMTKVHGTSSGANPPPPIIPMISDHPVFKSSVSRSMPDRENESTSCASVKNLINVSSNGNKSENRLRRSYVTKSDTAIPEYEDKGKKNGKLTKPKDLDESFDKISSNLTFV